MENLERILLEHPLLAGLDSRFAALVTGCAKNVRYESGAYLGREGQSCDEFFLLREGRVALEICAPGRGSLTFQTRAARSGASACPGWCHPIAGRSMRARWNRRAPSPSMRAACAASATPDHDLGYEMMKRFTPVLLERLHATRLQLLDLYGKAGAAR